jgi:hypothetical protein
LYGYKDYKINETNILQLIGKGGRDYNAISCANVLSIIITVEKTTATASFFVDKQLCKQCYDYVYSNMRGKDIIRYLSFAEDHYYGELSDKILDTCVAALCRDGAGTLSPWVPLLPLEWFQRILTSNALCIKTEMDRYLFVQAMIYRRRKSKRRIRIVVHNDDEDSSKGSDSEDEDVKKYSRTLPEYEEDEADLLNARTEVEIVDEEDVFKEILSTGVVYNHLPFNELLAMRKNKYTLVDKETLQKALWNQVHLKYMIERAGTDAKELGISYEMDLAEDSVRVDHSDGGSTPLNTESASKLSVVPPEDTDTIDAKT